MKKSQILTLAAIAAMSASAFADGGIKVKIDNAYARPTADQVPVSAVFADITNRSGKDIYLLGARTDASLDVELHETVMEGDVMKMRPVSAVKIGKGETFSLKPGAHHIMLNRVLKPLQENAKFEVEFVFADGDGVFPAHVEDEDAKVVVQQVKAESGMDMGKMNHDMAAEPVKAKAMDKPAKAEKGKKAAKAEPMKAEAAKAEPAKAEAAKAEPAKKESK